jgi:hypothetical protein
MDIFETQGEPHIILHKKVNIFITIKKNFKNTSYFNNVKIIFIYMCNYYLNLLTCCHFADLCYTLPSSNSIPFWAPRPHINTIFKFFNTEPGHIL